MKCMIRHESRGRLRVHLCCARMTLQQADLLEYTLRAVEGVTDVKVYDRTQDAVVLYRGERKAVLQALASFSFARAAALDLVPEHTPRALNREFEDKLAGTILAVWSPNCSCRCRLQLRFPFSVPLSTSGRGCGRCGMASFR